MRLPSLLSLLLITGNLAAQKPAPAPTPAPAATPPTSPPATAATPAVSYESTRETLQKWAETEKRITDERREWDEGKALLRGQIELVNGQIRELQEKIADAKKRKEEALAKKEEMLLEKTRIRETATEVNAMADALEKAVREAVALVPESIAKEKKLDILVAQLDASQKAREEALRESAAGKEKVIPIASRYQAVVGLIDQVNQAYPLLHKAVETRKLPDGRETNVTVVYVGLGQAYFVNLAGDFAGTGTPGPGGWQWTTRNEIARDVTQIIDVLDKSGSPKVFPLPASVK